MAFVVEYPLSDSDRKALVMAIVRTRDELTRLSAMLWEDRRYELVDRPDAASTRDATTKKVGK